jgi:Regulator of ribonuclease activity B
MMRVSNKNSAKKARIGDIVEISTPGGLGYVQYTHDAGTNGELVRVLPGLYTNRPSDFAALARQKELYFVFYIMDYALRAGQAKVVSNQSVPEWARAHPMMRHAAAFDDFRRVIRWRIVSAASQLTPEELIRTPLLTELTPEQEKLSIREIWPHAVMVKELARGWTPERAEELRLQDVAEAEKQKASAPHENRASEPMKHYLYFPKKPNAEEAGERLRSRGFSVEVRKGAKGEDWLALATKAPPKTGEQMDELRDEMEALAAQFGGEYDGWEAAIDSLGSGNVEHGQKVN